MGFANKMAPDVFESISCADHESSPQVFEKKAVETPKNCIFGNF